MVYLIKFTYHRPNWLRPSLFKENSPQDENNDKQSDVNAEQSSANNLNIVSSREASRYVNADLVNFVLNQAVQTSAPSTPSMQASANSAPSNVTPQTEDDAEDLSDKPTEVDALGNETWKDKNGTVRKRVIYQYGVATDQLAKKTIYLYDKNGKLTSESVHHYNFPEGKLDSIETTRYNENEKPEYSETVRFKNDGSSYISEMTKYTYDNSGEVASISTTSYDENGNVQSGLEKRQDGSSVQFFIKDGVTYENTYDKDGNRIRSITKYAGSVTYDYSYEYQDGKLVKESHNFYDKDGTLYSSSEDKYEYNVDGSYKKTSTDSNGTVYVEFYDKDENMTRQEVYHDGNLSYLMETLGNNGVRYTDYDSNGNPQKVVEEVRSESSKSTQTTYYDANGNVSQAVKSEEYVENGVTTTVNTRYDSDGNVIGKEVNTKEKAESVLVGEGVYELKQNWTHKLYDAEGNIIEWQEHRREDGADVRIEYYPDGTIKSIERHVDGAEYCERTEYDENGNIVKSNDKAYWSESYSYHTLV